MVITEDFREKVDKAARAAASGNGKVEWEDVAQDIWVRLVEDQKYYATLCDMEDPFPSLKKVAKQEIYKQNSAYEHFTGDYTYTNGEVRGLLKEHLFEPTLETISEHSDLVEGLLMVKAKSHNQFNLLINKFVHGIEVDSRRESEAVDKLVYCMNQVNKSARYSYEGPGSRRAVTNAAAQAKSWNQMEQNNSRGTNWS